MGRTIECAFLALVKEISKDFKVKLHAVPSEEQLAAINHRRRQWKMTKLCNVAKYGRLEQALQTSCQKMCMSHLIMKLLVAPPVTPQRFFQKIAATQVEKESDIS